MVFLKSKNENLNISPLHVYCQNVDCLRSKIVELVNALSTSFYDIIILVESWLSKNIPDSEINIPSYNKFLMWLRRTH